MHEAEFEDGTGSRRPLLGDAGVSPRRILCRNEVSVFAETSFLSPSKNFLQKVKKGVDFYRTRVYNTSSRREQGSSQEHLSGRHDP